METSSPVKSHMRRLKILFQIAACLLALGFALTATRALADAVDAAIDKANVYIELAKSTERAVQSWERYLSWVNIKTGPTGKERYIDYGLYEVSDEVELIEQTREMTGKTPKVEKLDVAIKRFLSTYETLVPVMNEAAAYYDNKDYMRDKVARGRALHKNLVSRATTFLAEREAMIPELRAFVRDVNAQEVKAIEAREGLSAMWHVADVMHCVHRVIDLFPRVRPQPIGGDEMEQMMQSLGPRTSGKIFDQIISGVKAPKVPPIDVAAFDTALKTYSYAVARLDNFTGKPSRNPEYFSTFLPMPRQMLALLTAFREPLAKSKGKEFDAAGRMTGLIYERYIEMLNASSALGASRLRYLP